jgi:hypothetical protein
MHGKLSEKSYDVAVVRQPNPAKARLPLMLFHPPTRSHRASSALAFYNPRRITIFFVNNTNEAMPSIRVVTYFTRRLLGLDLTLIFLHNPGSASQKAATRSMGTLLKVDVAAVRPPCGNCELQRS